MINSKSENIMETKTAKGVEYYQNWETSEGGIVMTNAKTIKRYRELNDEQPKSEDYGVFFAFSQKQFDEGVESLKRRGFIKDASELRSAGNQMVGTESEIRRFFKFYEGRAEKIKAECNPQEVYFYEWNNHECMISMDDDGAMQCIIETFGKEVAHTIERLYPGTPINILAPLTTRDEHLRQYDSTLMMLGRLSYDCHGFFSERSCCYHRPDYLWAGNIKGQIAEMRKLYEQLPDDIKDASCMTKDEIEDYAQRMTDWAGEHFSKPDFDPIPHTPREQYEGLEIALGYKRLRYKDDDGHWHYPDTVWFSNDTRRWHQDESCVAGRAYTSYLGKHGTTLARVYIDTDSLSYQPYTLPHLCDVTARYNPDWRENKLYGFYHE